MFPMAACSTAGFSPLVTLSIAIFCLWLYKKLTANQPEGFLVLKIASGFGMIINLPVVRDVPALRKVAMALIKGVNFVWINSGLLPTPSYCNLYER